MILKFSKQNPYLIERAKYFKGAGAWFNNVLQITSEDARILRWQENDDEIVIQFDRNPGEAAAYGKQIDSFTFDKPDKTLIFDMKKMFELGYDEHPSATAGKLKLICIDYTADEAAMKAKMVVFDPFDNVPEWVTLLNPELVSTSDPSVYFDVKKVSKLAEESGGTIKGRMAGSTLEFIKKNTNNPL